MRRLDVFNLVDLLLTFAFVLYFSQSIAARVTAYSRKPPETACGRHRENRHLIDIRRKLRNIVFVFIGVLFAVRLKNELKRLSGR